MKSTVIPLTCGIAVAAMCAAGLSHWWSVHQLIAMMDEGPMTPPPLVAGPPDEQPPALAKTDGQPVIGTAPAAEPPVEPAATPPGQQQFYESLVSRIENLQNQNRDLLDQLAETNRDLMKLEFRVDTHSTSFRPLPVTEEQPFTTLDTDIGVLPPRAEVVLPPLYD